MGDVEHTGLSEETERRLTLALCRPRWEDRWLMAEGFFLLLPLELVRGLDQLFFGVNYHAVATWLASPDEGGNPLEDTEWYPGLLKRTPIRWRL